MEAIAPGCRCEGWGAADTTSGTTGYANVDTDGVVGLTVLEFISTATTATSVVQIDSTLVVTHDYRPSRSPDLYEAAVTIENVGTTDVDARYRRVMDWDVEPTPFSEHVTNMTGGLEALLHSNNDGFATANPLGDRISGDPDVGPIVSGDFTDEGPSDHGALFDFGFGPLTPGESISFSIYYGAAATETDALAALQALGIATYSLAQTETPEGKTQGTPNTFIFGFGYPTTGGLPTGDAPFTNAPAVEATSGYYFENGAATNASSIFCYGRAGTSCGGWYFPAYAYSQAGAVGGLADGAAFGVGNFIDWILTGPANLTIHTFVHSGSGLTYRLRHGPNDGSWPTTTITGIGIGDETISVATSGPVKFRMDLFAGSQGGRIGFDGVTVLANPIAMEPAPAGTVALENGVTAGDPVQTFSGAFLYSFTDLAISGRGPSPTFTRSYNSADTRTGPMGQGWTHGYAARLRDPGDSSSDLLFVRPDGNTDRFTDNPDGSFSPSPATYATLVQNPDETYTVTEQSGFRWSFSSAGSLTALTDRSGNTSTLGYDGAGQLTSVSDPAGRGSLTLAYTDGLLTSVTDWASPVRIVTYQYDANGRLWKVTDRENQTTTFGYDGITHRLTTITDARGNVALTLTYDAQGRVATQKDAQGLVTGATTTFAYVVNPDGTRLTTVTAPPASFEPSFAPTIEDTYDSQGWLTQRVSRPTSTETLTESFTYDAIGNQTSITDARGNTTNLCYDVDYAGAAIAGSRGNLTRRIDPAPTGGANRPVTLFAYDAKNNATQVVAPKGVPSGTSVTCSTNLSAINNSYATDLAYDATGALLLSSTSRFTDPDSGLKTAITKFEYDDPANPGQLTRLIPPRGNTGPSPDYSYATTMTYGASGSQAGMLTTTSDPLGNTTTFAYDAIGRLTSTVDPLGNAAGGNPADHTSTFAYDNEDRVRFSSAPAPQAGGSPLTTESRYDEVGNRTVQLDANGQVTTYAYDERDGLFQVKESPLVWTDPASPPATVITTEYAYDGTGNLTRMTRGKGDPANERVTDYAHDGRNLVRRETQYPAWPTTSPTLVTTSAYDPNGNPLTLVDPLGQTTTYSYDALNHLTDISYSDPGTADVTYGYDANGNRTSMTDATGSTAYIYDEANRLTLVTSPGPTTVGYRYDVDGNRANLIYPDATAVTYVFNQASQLSALTDWASRQVAYTYSADGALETVSNPNGTVTSYAYDNARRLRNIDHTFGASPILDLGYELDNVGNVTEIAEAGSPVSTYAFDRLYRLTSATEPIVGATTYAYDPAGNRASRVRAGTTSYNYDRADRITSIQTPPTPSSSTRPPSSNDAGWTSSANGYTSDNAYATTAPGKNKTKTLDLGTFGFDSIPTNATITGVTVSVEWKVSTTASIATLGARAYVNGSGVGTEFVSNGEPTSDTTQTFTVPGLTRAQLLNGAFSVGIRATRGNSNTAFTASLDAVSVTVDYTVPGTQTLTTDANGNLVAKGADTFVYDQANRLISATVAGATETYAYDGDGVRFSRTVGGGPAIRYVSDVNASLPITIDDGTRKYVWGLGLAYAVDGASIEIYHADRLGSIRAITDATGAVTATYRTDEYGVPTATTGSSSQPFGFAGEPRDGTDLNYLRARYYDPSLGRFQTRDSWPGVMSAPVTLNRFGYSESNPTTVIDPSGNNPCVPAAIQGATIGGAGGSVLPGPGTAVGAAGGGLVGFLVCAAVVVASVVIVEQVMEAGDSWLHAQNNKQKRKRIQGLQDQIDEHQGKLRDPNDPSRRHHEKEIQGWQRQIDKLQKKLPGRRKGGFGSQVLVLGKEWSNWLP